MKQEMEETERRTGAVDTSATLPLPMDDAEARSTTQYDAEKTETLVQQLAKGHGRVIQSK